MAKKIISLVLVVLTLMGTLSIAANAASYSTGSYTVTAYSGVNVRRGAGTGYSRVGCAANGTTFTVSKISGSWGYSSGIKCTNGTRSGWVSLNNCRYNNSNRSSYNDVFASVRGSGYSLSQGKASGATTFDKGTFVYVWGYLHDGNGNLYKTYGSGKCNLTLSIYRPDGSCAYSYTYNNCDSNWIGCKLDKAGTWKIQSRISGSLSGTNTQTITVRETATKLYTLTYNANGGYHAPANHMVKAGEAFYLRSSQPTRSGYTFLGWSTNRNATSASYTPNHYVCINGNVTLYAVWKKATVKPTGVSLNYTSITMDQGATRQLTATIYPSNATDKSVTWKSSDSGVVSVSNTGKLTARKPGTATITVTTDNGKTKTCKVTVKGIIISSLDFFYTSMTVGDVKYLYATACPSDTTRFSWKSSNSWVVSVNSSGKLTAKSAGTATITVKTSDGRTASFNVTVSEGKQWQTGKFDAGYTAKGYTAVALNTHAGDGYIRIYSYDQFGNETSGKLHIVLKDAIGNYICEFDAKSGDKLKLGDDHSGYQVYVAKKNDPYDWLNIGKCYYWAIQCVDDCYITKFAEFK